MLKRKLIEVSKQKPTTPSGSQQRRQHVKARRNLPVAKFRSEICSLVKENDVVLVVAETVSCSTRSMKTSTISHTSKKHKSNNLLSR